MGRNTHDDEQLLRLAVAHHEIGHAVAYKLAGHKVRSVRINGSNDGSGNTSYVPTTVPETEVGPWLVTILAGGEAHAHFLTRHGYSLAAARRAVKVHCSGDLAAFRSDARGTGISESTARADARRLVTSHWSRIQRAADKLARSGRLSGSAI